MSDKVYTSTILNKNYRVTNCILHENHEIRLTVSINDAQSQIAHIFICQKDISSKYCKPLM